MADDWVAPWRCPWTGKQEFTFTPDFSGLDPDTGEPWSPKKVVELMGLKKSSSEEVVAACRKVLDANPKQVESYRSGKTNLMGFFMKLVMDETQKRADPKVASQTLQELLKV